MNRREHLALLTGAGGWALAGMPGIAAAASGAVGSAPRNPYLADSSYTIAHGNSAQTDSTLAAGPTGPSRALAPDEMRHRDLGIFHLMSLVSGPYADGKRVVWTNGAHFVAKLDYDSYDLITALRLPDAGHTDTLAQETFLEWLDAPGDLSEKLAMVRKLPRERSSGIYTMIDRDNQFVMCGDTWIKVYGDTVPGDRTSGIMVRQSWTKPTEIAGTFVGMNMTFDGRIVVATTDGYVLALKRDFSGYEMVRLPGAEAEVPMQPAGVYWIRNSFALDERGGVYVASQNHMHKLVWTGSKLSVDPADGAWHEPYPNSRGRGTGATPTLVGFGNDPDKFVVITDGDKLMNLALFWRDAIPRGARRLSGRKSARLAGLLPCNFGDPDLKAAQSEQSVVVSGYGMAVVNNEPRNLPADYEADRTTKALVIGYLNHLKDVQPFGVQKFEWDPVGKRLKSAWINREVSSPNCVPFAAAGSNMFYVIGARDEKFTLEGIDWTTGRSVFHYLLGGSRFNSFYSPIVIDDDGRAYYGGLYGPVRLQPRK